MLKANCTYEYICRELKISTKTISAISQEKDLNHRRGRPPKITAEVLEYIEMHSLANALLTDQDIADLVQEKFGFRLPSGNREQKEETCFYISMSGDCTAAHCAADGCPFRVC